MLHGATGVEVEYWPPTENVSFPKLDPFGGCYIVAVGPNRATLVDHATWTEWITKEVNLPERNVLLTEPYILTERPNSLQVWICLQC